VRDEAGSSSASRIESEGLAEPRVRAVFARTRLDSIAAMALPALVAAGVYTNTLSNGLAGDDPWTYEVVTGNPGIWRAMGARSVTYALHALDVWTWSGSFVGLHVTNVVLHAAATALAASAARLLTDSKGVGMLCGILFAVHPVHVEAVASFSNRKDILAMIFLMLALLCWVRSRGWVRIIGTSILLCFSLFSKEVAAVGGAIMVPAATLAMVRDGRSVVRDEWSGRIWIAGSILVVLVAALVTWSIAGNPLLYFEASSIRDTFGTLTTYREALATALAEVPSVARLLIVPVHLSADYPVPDPVHLDSFAVLSGTLLLVAWSIGSIAAICRSPILGYACSWVLVTLLPVSNVIPVTEFFVADRYLYVPSFGVCLGAAIGVVRILQIVPSDRKGLRLACWFLVGAVVTAAATRSILRNRDWANQWVLADSALSSGFETARVHRSVGFGYLAHGYPELAEVHFRTAIALAPRIRDELASPLAVAQTLLGRRRETEWFPLDAAGLDLVAEALVARNRRPLAIQLLRMATRESPRYGGDLAWVLSSWRNVTREEVNEAQRIAIRSAELPGAPRDRVWALCAAAVAQSRVSDYAAAVTLARRALDLAEKSSDRWIASVSRLVLSNAEHSRPVVLRTHMLFGLLWKTHFAYDGEPQCHHGFHVPVVNGELSFDRETGIFTANFLECERGRDQSG